MATPQTPELPHPSKRPIDGIFKFEFYKIKVCCDVGARRRVSVTTFILKFSPELETTLAGTERKKCERENKKLSQWDTPMVTVIHFATATCGTSARCQPECGKFSATAPICG